MTVSKPLPEQMTDSDTTCSDAMQMEPGWSHTYNASHTPLARLVKMRAVMSPPYDVA